jgi:hypothetical protein
MFIAKRPERDFFVAAYEEIVVFLETFLIKKIAAGYPDGGLSKGLKTKRRIKSPVSAGLFSV